jgi:hypothetical protein
MHWRNWRYWSGTEYGFNNAYYVQFADGTIAGFNRNHAIAVRLVRSGQ